MEEWEARQEARRRWGPNAFVEQTLVGYYVRPHRKWGKGANECGFGHSWEEAIASIDERRARNFIGDLEVITRELISDFRIITGQLIKECRLIDRALRNKFRRRS